MDKQEFGIIAKAMKAIYTDPKFIPDRFAADIWYGLLKEYSYKDTSAAVSAYMASDVSGFPPTPGKIIDKIKRLHPENKQLTAPEAWAMVRKAIADSTYHADERFAELPEVVQRAVGSPDQMREMAQMTVDTVDSVEQSHFIRAYNAALAQADEQSRYPAQIREQLAQASEKALGDGT